MAPLASTILARRSVSRLGLLLAFILALVSALVPIPAHAAVSITINGNDQSGRTFDGIGAVSAGATTRNLWDYNTGPGGDTDESQARGQILAYLFKPNWGASLQRLKVEIGGDSNSTWGAEASHERVDRASKTCNRLYEWALMQDAKTFNPNIKFDAETWALPGWLGGTLASAPQNNANYVKDWLDCASNPTYGNNLSIDTLGLQSEYVYTAGNPPAQDTYIKSYLCTPSCPTPTKIIASDGIAGEGDPAISCNEPAWSIVTDISGDPSLAADVGYVGVHYPSEIGQYNPDGTLRHCYGYLNPDGTNAPDTYGSPASARGLSQRLWSNEDGQDGDPLFNQAQTLIAIAKLLNRNYIKGKYTSTAICCLLESWYYNVGYPAAQPVGLLRADSAWMGHYTIDDALCSLNPPCPATNPWPLWAVAHTTQVTQMGWKYLNSGNASACLTGGLSADCASANTSYVSLAQAANSNFSTIIETTGESASQTFNFTLQNVAPSQSCSGGYATCVHVWTSNIGARSYFQQQSDVQVVSNAFSLTVPANAIVSVTTLTTPNHPARYGNQVDETSTDGTFPIPYSDSWTNGTVGEISNYWSDQEGAFNVANCAAVPGVTGKCYRQVINQTPTKWRDVGAPYTILGDPGTGHYNYTVSAVAYIEPGQPAGASAKVLARAMGQLVTCGTNLVWEVDRYEFKVDNSGNAYLQKTNCGAVVQLVSPRCGTVALPPTDQFRQMQIAVSGSTITAYYNGNATALCSATDTALPKGGAGLGTGYNFTQFGNFSVG